MVQAKKPYLVTALAGKEVAGIRSEGDGSQIWLTDAQAKHPLRLGHVELRHPLDHDGDGRPGGSTPRARRKNRR